MSRSGNPARRAHAREAQVRVKAHDVVRAALGADSHEQAWSAAESAVRVVGVADATRLVASTAWIAACFASRLDAVTVDQILSELEWITSDEGHL
jgi:hypothetical protein